MICYNYHMELKYPVIIYYSPEDKGYIAIAIDLAGCSVYGQTPERALEDICIAIDTWLDAAHREGRKIPQPNRSVKGIKARGEWKKRITVKRKNLRKPLVIDLEVIRNSRP